MRVLSNKRGVLVVALAALATSATAVGAADATPAKPSDGRQVLAGSLAPDIAGARATGSASSTASRTVQVWLRGNQTAAEAFAAKVSDPSSPSYHHYLTPAQYAQRFGPSASDTAAVRTWLGDQGFSGIKAVGRSGALSATARTGTLQSAFGVKLKTYRVTSGGKAQTVTANDRSITLPTSIAGKILAVTGLDTHPAVLDHTAKQPNLLTGATLPTPSKSAKSPASKCSKYWGQHFKTGIKFKNYTKVATHVCGYNGSQLRAAYNLTSAQTGKGTTIAYIEIGTPYEMFDTLTTWASKSKLPAPKSTQYTQLSIGSGNECGNEFDVEEQLDVEAGYAMAPKAHHLLVGGDTCGYEHNGTQPLFDAIQTVLDGNGHAPLATIASNSWGIGTESSPAIYSKLAHAQLVQAASEGVTMAFAAGDDPGSSIPSTDPYALSVGGTSLGLNAKNQRVFETGWSAEGYFVDGTYGSFDMGLVWSTGGGTSLLWKQPSYQKKAVPASMTRPSTGSVPGPNRAAPDISAVADPMTGIGQLDIVKTKKGDKYEWFADGGTSLATPLVSGILADAQQGQRRPLGFVNPALYKLAGTSALHDALPVTSSTPKLNRAAYCPESVCGFPGVLTFDSQNRDYTDQVTAKGYDTMTGLGTPDAPKLIAALHKK